MANIIRINGGSAELTGNATTSDVLSGKTFYNNDSDNKLNGSMPNNGAWNKTINAGESVVIPKGYHDGNGKVISNKYTVESMRSFSRSLNFDSNYNGIGWPKSAEYTFTCAPKVIAVYAYTDRYTGSSSWTKAVLQGFVNGAYETICELNHTSSASIVTSKIVSGNGKTYSKFKIVLSQQSNFYGIKCEYKIYY